MATGGVNRETRSDPDARVAPGQAKPLTIGGLSQSGSDPASLECPIFADRRREAPQEVIDALVAQTARQGAAIHALIAEIEALKAENAELTQQTAAIEMPLFNAQRTQGGIPDLGCPF